MSKHVELRLETSKRGMRVCTSIGVCLAEHIPGDQDGYLGTILEVTNSIPNDVPCPLLRGRPGALVYWDWITQSGEYHEILSAAEAVEAQKQKASWVCFFES